MRGSIKLVWADNLIRISLLSSLLLMVFLSIVVVVLYSKFPPLIPLINSQPWGESRLVGSQAIFILPLSLFLIFLFNNFLSAFFYKKNTLVSRILSFNSLLLIIIGFIAFVEIFFLVF